MLRESDSGMVQVALATAAAGFLFRGVGDDRMIIALAVVVFFLGSFATLSLYIAYLLSNVPEDSRVAMASDQGIPAWLRNRVHPDRIAMIARMWWIGGHLCLTASLGCLFWAAGMQLSSVGGSLFECVLFLTNCF